MNLFSKIIETIKMQFRYHQDASVTSLKDIKCAICKLFPTCEITVSKSTNSIYLKINNEQGGSFNIRLSDHINVKAFNTHIFISTLQNCNNKYLIYRIGEPPMLLSHSEVLKYIKNFNDTIVKDKNMRSKSNIKNLLVKTSKNYIVSKDLHNDMVEDSSLFDIKCCNKNNCNDNVKSINLNKTENTKTQELVNSISIKNQKSATDINSLKKQCNDTFKKIIQQCNGHQIISEKQIKDIHNKYGLPFDNIDNLVVECYKLSIYYVGNNNFKKCKQIFNYIINLALSQFVKSKTFNIDIVKHDYIETTYEEFRNQTQNKNINYYSSNYKVFYNTIIRNEFPDIYELIKNNSDAQRYFVIITCYLYLIDLDNTLAIIKFFNKKYSDDKLMSLKWISVYLKSFYYIRKYTQTDILPSKMKDEIVNIVKIMNNIYKTNNNISVLKLFEQTYDYYQTQKLAIDNLTDFDYKQYIAKNTYKTFAKQYLSKHIIIYKELSKYQRDLLKKIFTKSNEQYYVLVQQINNNNTLFIYELSKSINNK